MKQLTKEQLYDLVFDNWGKAIKENSEKIDERVRNAIKGSEDNVWEMLIRFIITYGTEIKRESCQVITDTLYEILYSE